MSVHDRNRVIFNNMMKDSGIRHGSVQYKKLRDFLDDPVNSPYLQTYYLLCAGYLDKDEIVSRTTDLIAELDYDSGGNYYTYRKLFNIDPEWYQFFKENAYPTGQRRPGSRDARRGVDSGHVDEIMRIKIGPPPIDLESAMKLQLNASMRARAEAIVNSGL